MDVNRFQNETKKLLADYAKMVQALDDVTKQKDFPQDWAENFKKVTLSYLNQGLNSSIMDKIHKEMGFPVLK